MYRRTYRKRNPTVSLLAAVCLLLTACALPAGSAPSEPDSAMEVQRMDFSQETDNVIYLAGGCFWDWNS